MNSKRITKLVLENFRGFNGRYEFDLNADLILLAGKNGVGKSSILYAIDRLLNGYSKNGNLSKLEKKEILNFDKNEGKLECECLPSGKKSIKLTPKGKNFSKSNDDEFSFLYEIGSVFYQEYLDNIGVDGLVNVMFGNVNAIKIEQHLKDMKEKYIPEIIKEYLPSKIDKWERRKAFLSEWKRHIDKLKQSTELFGDIEQNFVLNNKGVPKYLEKQFSNFSKYLINKITYLHTSVKNKEIISHRNSLDYDNKSGFNYDEIMEYVQRDNQTFSDVLRIIREEFRIVKNFLMSEKKKEPSDLYAYRDYLITDKFVSSSMAERVIYFINTRDLQNKKEKTDKKMASIEAQLKKIRNSLDLFNLPGRSSFSETLKSLKSYSEEISKIKKSEFYYPTKVVLWLGRFGNDVDKMINELDRWQKNLLIEKKKLESKLDSLKFVVNNIRDSLNFIFLLRELKLFEKTERLIKLGGKDQVIHVIQKLGINAQSNNLSTVDILQDLLDLLENQIEEEMYIQREIKEEKLKSTNLREKEVFIDTLKNIIEKEDGSSSILKSSIHNISSDKLKKISKMLNEILYLFHFSRGLLPLQVTNRGTKRNPKYTITTGTGRELNFASLSTGQKSQIAISWLITLNYLLRNKIPHNVIMFDDITTSLDLAQFIPASVLFRRLAYTSDENRRKQVFITSHHDDLTNRFIDFLMPPPGRSMKVIYFEDWTANGGPEFKEYYISPSRSDIEHGSDYYEDKKKKIETYINSDSCINNKS